MLSTLAEHCLLHRFDARGELMLAAMGFAVSGELHRYAEPVPSGESADSASVAAVVGCTNHQDQSVTSKPTKPKNNQRCAMRSLPVIILAAQGRCTSIIAATNLLLANHL